MDWQVDPADGRAPYDQLRLQIIDDMRAGRLRVGARLPTVRELAHHTGVAVNTAARTYRELEAGGLVQTRGRAGTFVLGGLGSVQSAAAEAARAYLDRIRELGIGADEAVEIVRDLARDG